MTAASAQEREVLASAKRGEEFVVKPKATYRSGYDWEDICELGARIRDPRDELTLAIIRKNPSEYKVPYGTMRSWCAPQGPQGAPRWLVERDQRRRHSLPQSGGVKGGGTVLGRAAELRIMIEIAQAAKAKMPFLKEELEELIRKTAIELGCLVRKTGQPYTQLTDVKTLVAAFIRRAAQDGIHLVEKNARKFAVQRHINQNYTALKAFAVKASDALLKIQKKHNLKLTPRDAGNWDETMADLCSITEGIIIVLKHMGNLMLVPFEVSPHITIIVGFANGKRFILLVIIKGKEGEAPSPFHGQLLNQGDGVYVGQSESGWVTNDLKVAYFKLQLEAGILGQTPTVVNVDGHDSNRNNEELEALAEKHNVLLMCPPSHTSAAVDGMGTQQCDRPAHQGGPIARLKAAFRRHLRKQFFAAVRNTELKGRVTTAEILKMLAMAWDESFNADLIGRLNEDVGYYVNEDGILQWDITRLLPQHAPASEPQQSVTAPGTGMYCSPAGSAACIVPVLTEIVTSPPAPARGRADEPAAAPPAAAEPPAVAEPSAAAEPPAMAPPAAAAPFIAAPRPGAAQGTTVPDTQSRFGPKAFGRQAVQQSQAQQWARIESARAELAVGKVLHQMQQPVVAPPQERIARDAATKQHSKFGLIIGSEEHQAAKVAVRERQASGVAKKAKTQAKFWSNHRAGVRAAEEVLAECDGDASQLSVSHVKNLIISRTGHMPKSKNNTGGAMLTEALEAIEKQSTTLLPPTPPSSPARSAPAADGTTPECRHPVDQVCSACNADTAEVMADENGMRWCTSCMARLDEPTFD